MEPAHRVCMMDLIFLVVVVAVFAGAIAYVQGCERL
jgi:hypothetical protein